MCSTAKRKMKKCELNQELLLAKRMECRVEANASVRTREFLPRELPHKLRFDSHACSLQSVWVHEENSHTIVKGARQASYLGLLFALDFFQGTKIYKHREGFPLETPSNTIDKAMAKNYAREEHDQVFIQCTHLQFPRTMEQFFLHPSPSLAPRTSNSTILSVPPTICNARCQLRGHEQ